MRFPLIPVLLFAVLLVAAADPADGQHFCDSPPVLNLLSGEEVSVSGLQSEGHPSGYSWYITPPSGQVPGKPTSTEAIHSFSPATPGLWSVALVTDYEHFVEGSPWTSEDCVTVNVATVVSSIGLSSTQIATDEELELDGFGSQWAGGANPVEPIVEWLVDGQSVGSCGGSPPPTHPSELTCTIQANWLGTGWHTASLRLTDPAYPAVPSIDTKNFEVIEIIPLSVDFDWSPTEPVPGQTVNFVAVATPQILEEDLETVTWVLGDGTTMVYDSCPPYFGSCLQSPHSYGTDGWYDVSVTIETEDETAFQSHRVKVGDPIPPPVASFAPSPSTALLLSSVNLGFDGSCEGQCEWSWDFDDGSQSSVQSPSHIWNIPATYTVSLTVTNESGSDGTTRPVVVGNCWNPATPVQDGNCYGGPVALTAPSGSAWSWNTGASIQAIAAPFAGSYWVNIENGSSCWGHAPATVVLTNCGDPSGDVDLDGGTDGADIAALIPELTDGDGDTVVGAGGGDLSAPGGDVNVDDRLRIDDLLTVLDRLFG